MPPLPNARASEAGGAARMYLNSQIIFEFIEKSRQGHMDN
jgi:hypothetical protein